MNNSVPLAVAFSLILSADVIRAADGEKKTVPAWPPASGWRSETIPFPLDFAPGIKREGIEEIRFSPGFSKPSDPSYFTYAFIWALTSGQEIDAGTLRKELTMYFDGLMREVAAGKKLDLAFETKVGVERGKDSAGFPSSPTFRASVATLDAFYTKKPLLLEINIYADACPGSNGRIVYFEASPKLLDRGVAQDLSEIRSRLACRSKEPPHAAVR